MDVVLLGPMPTPAVAMLTTSMRADLGVMISASHNPFADNGIKLFGPDGYKPGATTTNSRSRRCSMRGQARPAAEIGRARRVDDAQGRYIHFAKSTFPTDLRLDGLKIVIDCANGAAYRVAPSALWGTGRRDRRDRCQSRWPQHQRPGWLDRAANAFGDRRRVGRRHRVSHSMAMRIG